MKKYIILLFLLFLAVTIKGFEFTDSGLYIMTYDWSYNLFKPVDCELIMIDCE